jgi:hypothetical protein
MLTYRWGLHRVCKMQLIACIYFLHDRRRFSLTKPCKQPIGKPNPFSRSLFCIY